MFIRFSGERRKRPLGRFLLLFLICILTIGVLSPYCFAARQTITTIDNFAKTYGTVTYNETEYTVYNYSLGKADDELQISITVDLGLKKKNPKYNFYFGGATVPVIGTTIASNNDFGTLFTKKLNTEHG